MATMSNEPVTSGMRRGPDGLVSSEGRRRALASAMETWFAAATECQREMIGFVSERLGKDGEAAREMLACKSSADATAIQTRWIEETLRDYASEMNKLMALCNKAMESNVRSEE